MDTMDNKDNVSDDGDETNNNNINDNENNNNSSSNDNSNFSGQASSANQSNPSSSSRTNSSRFATIHDLENEPMDEDDDDDDDNKNLFAGGEKSGIFMQNPNAKPIKQTSSLVSDILKKATEGSRAHIEEPEATTSSSSSSSSYVFGGTGYKLGSDEEPSTVIPGPPSNNITEEESATTVRHLTFWRNGFSVEDGPLMTYDDPENQEFLKAIRSGRAPLSLLNVSQNQPVDVRVSRRLDEEYKSPPRQPTRPFSGSGQRLGSIIPAVASETTTSTTSSSTPSIREFEIDESLPITSLQIRLGDGTRMLARFNHTHTINDIRNFINASRVGEAQRNYSLQTSFPVKDLKDGSQTLIDASLLNSVVIQRYI